MMRTMKRVSLVFILICVLLLSSCKSVFGVPAPTITPKPTSGQPTRTLAPTATAAPTARATKTPTPEPTLAITPSGPATCSVASIQPEVNPTVAAIIPGESEYDHFIGAESARITIIEYTDFQCQVCADLSMNLRQLQVLYPEEVRVILRYLPLTEEHDKAALASQAAEAAGLQDKYWEMHDLLFTLQDDWVSLSEDEFSTWVIGQAVELKLDKQQFTADLTSDEIITRVFEATRDSAGTTLSNPPAVFFNKIQYQDWVDLSSLVSMVEYFKLPDRAFSECPEMSIDPDKKYTATIATDKGEIVLELYPKQAPMAVNSFVFLARQKWFDNTSFFRVVPGFLVQAGDPTGSGFGKPGYQFTNEVTPKLRFNEPGMLAMSNYGDGTNGSQFFITYTSIPEFDGKYTIFGKVIEGMDVLESLRPRDPVYDQVLLTPDRLISITIEEE